MPDGYIRQKVWERDKGICQVCGKVADRANFHLAHNVARSLGGGDNLSNLFVAHPRCNLFMGPLTLKQAKKKLAMLES